MSIDLNKTAGVEIREEELTSADSLDVEKTKYTKSDKGSDQYGLAHIPDVLKSMENQFPFTAVLVSIIGYIVISSFGQMPDFKKFFSYLLFLAIVFCFYGYSKRNAMPDVGRMDYGKLNWYFIVLFLVFLSLAVYDHFGLIKSLISKV